MPQKSQADAATIERLKALSSPTMQNELDRALDCFHNDTFGLMMNWWPGDDVTFSVGWYQEPASQH